MEGAERPSARHSHSMSLYNGTLLVLGGSTGTSILADLWRYVIATGVWTKLPAMCQGSAAACVPTPRLAGHTASVAGDKLIVLGGRSPTHEFQTKVGHLCSTATFASAAAAKQSLCQPAVPGVFTVVCILVTRRSGMFCADLCFRLGDGCVERA